MQGSFCRTREIISNRSISPASGHQHKGLGTNESLKEVFAYSGICFIERPYIGVFILC